MEESIRVFIALLINDELKNKLKQVQDELKLSDADIKWIIPEGIHITLKFLGNVGISQIEGICKALSEIKDNFSPFSISLSSVGAFPNINCPQIIWVGIDEGKEVICELSHKIEDKLATFGFKKEKKKFNPHLTIGRVKSLKGFNELTKKLTMVAVPTGRMTMSNIHIMKSQLTQAGAIHSVLEKVSL